MSVRSAADLAHISPSTLSRWEAGTRLALVPELESLLRIYGMSQGDIDRILVSVDAPRAARAVRASDAVQSVPTGGDLLRAMRRRTGRSLPSIARQLQVAPSTVSRWESSTAHPNPESLERFLEIVGASQDEKSTLLASGVGKVKSDRRPFDADEYTAELDGIECHLVMGGKPETELRLLQILSNVWWARSEPQAETILRRARMLYATYLYEWFRLGEASDQADRVLDHGDPFDTVGIEAQRIRAVAMVLKGPTIRPHQGLCILQSCLAQVVSPTQRVDVLVDMADLSSMAGRYVEACSYAERACIAAEGRGFVLAEKARGALATARKDLEDLRKRPDVPWLACTFMLREHSLLASLDRKREMAIVAQDLTDLAGTHGLENFLAKLFHAEKSWAARLIKLS